MGFHIHTILARWRAAAALLDLLLVSFLLAYEGTLACGVQAQDVEKTAAHSVDTFGNVQEPAEPRDTVSRVLEAVGLEISGGSSDTAAHS